MNPHGSKLGLVSSAPHSPDPPDGQGSKETNPYLAIQDPELRLAVMSAHRQWAIRFAPWLLKEWDKA